MNSSSECYKQYCASGSFTLSPIKSFDGNENRQNDSILVEKQFDQDLSFNDGNESRISKNGKRKHEHIEEPLDTNAAALGSTLLNIDEDRLCRVEDFVLLKLKADESVAFRGIGKIRKLWGTAKLFGCRLKIKKDYILCLPDCACSPLLEIGKKQCLSFDMNKLLSSLNCSPEDFEDLKNYLSDINLLYSALFKLSTFISPIPMSLKNFRNEGIFSVEDQSLCGLIPTSHNIKISTEMKNVCKKLLEQAYIESKPIRVLICGDKNNGKSTFARYIINYILNRVPRIIYLDCDPGQCEFTPSSVLSLTEVHEPVFGPPFVHLKQPIYSVCIGHVSPQNIPDEYLSGIDELMKKYENVLLNSRSTPLIINTMGWVSGLGLIFLKETINMTKPDFVLQFYKANESEKLLVFDQEWIENQSGWMSIQTVKKQSHLKFESILIESKVQNPKKPVPKCNYNARDFRDFATISYFSCMRKNFDVLPIEKFRPFKTQLGRVALRILNAEVPFHEYLRAFNASIVALGNTSISQFERRPDVKFNTLKRSAKTQCLGFGIVRGVDEEKGEIYIIFPKSFKLIDRVNTLMKGELNLRWDIFIDSDKNPYCVKNFGRQTLVV